MSRCDVFRWPTRRLKMPPNTRNKSMSTPCNPPRREYIDICAEYLPTLPEYDLSYFDYLAELVSNEPMLERDKDMGGIFFIHRYRERKTVTPQGKIRDALEQEARDGYDYLAYIFDTPAYSLERYWPNRDWYGLMAPSEDGFVFHDDDTVLLEARGSLFHWVTFLPRRLGKASAYLAEPGECNGEPLQGDAAYRLRVPADVPAMDLWPVIVYSKKTKAFIHSDIDRAGLSSYDTEAMAVNDDGSVDIYIGAEPPAGFGSKWIPSAGRDFLLLFRFYGPEEPLFDKSFALPDIERMD